MPLSDRLRSLRGKALLAELADVSANNRHKLDVEFHRLTGEWLMDEAALRVIEALQAQGDDVKGKAEALRNVIRNTCRIPKECAPL